MPVTFGSFGDIVAVLQLAWQLRAALSQATGASAEIRELLIDVESFTRTLQNIKATIDRRRVPLELSVEHGIRHAIIACHAVLRAILAKLAMFRTRITNNVGAAAWRQYWAVTAWSILGGRKEVDAALGAAGRHSDLPCAISRVRAHDLSAVQDAVERQATTLERVYSVVQDIQVRFDVGVPTFQFYNERRMEYYQPVARTSLTRFLQLLEAGNKRQLALHGETSDSDLEQTLAVTQTQFVTKHCTHYFHFLSPIPAWSSVVDCCYFRERAFGEWQVLIGWSTPRQDTLRILKHLVERKHAPNTACSCEGPQCKVRFREKIRRAQYTQDMDRTIILLNQMTALGLAMQADAACKQYRMCEEIFTELRRLPKEGYLRQTIIPLLKLHVEHQRPSVDCIVRLLQNSPRSRSQLDLIDVDRVQFGQIDWRDFPPWGTSPSVPAWLSASFASVPHSPHFYVSWNTAQELLRYV